MHNVDLVELAPRVCPTRGFINIITVQMMEAGISVGLQSALVRL